MGQAGCGPAKKKKVGPKMMGHKELEKKKVGWLGERNRKPDVLERTATRCVPGA